MADSEDAVKKMDDRLKQLEKKQDDQYKKITEALDRIGGETYNFRAFLESTLVLLLRTSLTNDPLERLAIMLKATTVLPVQIYGLFIEEAIKNAYNNKIEFDKLSDVLITALGDKTKKINIGEIIRKTYGTLASQAWNRKLRNSDPPKLTQEVKEVERSEQIWYPHS